MIKINKGVPLPEAKTRLRYPMKELKPGNMFWLPKEVAKNVRFICANANSRLKPKKFEWRKVGQRYGIWRTK
jgi:hypothetical protein